KQRHAVIHGADFLAHNLGTRFAFQKYVICVKNIGVADDDIKVFFSTLLGDDAGNPTLSCHNLSHFRVESDLPPSSRNNWTSARTSAPVPPFGKKTPHFRSRQ